MNNKTNTSRVRAPWLKHYGNLPHTLSYSDKSMFGVVEETAQKYPNYIACDFMGRTISYAELVKQVRVCAKALRALGIQPGDRVTICLPNAPQTVIIFYAANLAGAVANMVHPLSAQSEIAFFLKDSRSVAAITLDQFADKLQSACAEVGLEHLHIILTSIADEMPPLTALGYRLTEGRKVEKPEGNFIWWKAFLRMGEAALEDFPPRGAEDIAAVLYSGGTTGVMKGILLTNLNFNALAAQIVAFNDFFRPGDKMLAIMPMFHGFGLGVSIHSMLFAGGRCILVPRFSPKSYVKLLKKYRPNFIAGVPSLFEALLRVPEADTLELSCLKGVFSGGDSLSEELKNRFDAFLAAHGAKIQVREGYGTTECVTASCLNPAHETRAGSIGIPFPDTFYKIVEVGGERELPYGQEGEICLSGPTVMKGYVNQPEETARTLRVHADGRLWVHTGDLGVMDEDGFIYFRQRIKRMIVTNGYNVYPSQIENILDAHEAVHMSCVVGVNDPIKMQKVMAYVMLKPGYKPSEALKEDILAYCRERIARYALPYTIEFRDQLPKTLVGKVAYRVLEEEANRIAQ